MVSRVSSRLQLRYRSSREEPFQVWVRGTLPEGDSGASFVHVDVPEGKLVVIEYVSAHMFLPAGQTVTTVVVDGTATAGSVRHLDGEADFNVGLSGYLCNRILGSIPRGEPMPPEGPNASVIR